MKKVKLQYITNIILAILALFLCLLMINLFKNNVKTKEIIDKDVQTYEDINKNNLVLEDEAENKKIIYSEAPKEKDVIGSIYIDGTNINSELVQTTNNNYYLSHDIYGNYDVLGSIFLDYRNSIKDRKLLIYGHNAKKLSGAPFHDLEEYLNYDFFSKHQYIILNIKGEIIKWQIFSVQILSKDDTIHTRIIFSDVKWLEHLNWMKVNSIYETGIPVEENDQVLTLQTCNYDKENTFIIVNAKRL